MKGKKGGMKQRREEKEKREKHKEEGEDEIRKGNQ